MPLLAVLQEFVNDPSKWKGDAVTEELRFGMRQRYVLFEKGTDLAVPFKRDGFKLKVLRTATTIDPQKLNVSRPIPRKSGACSRAMHWPGSWR